MSVWTIFYWAWWISWAPFVGTFIARISRGRTIREFIIGVLAVPSLVSFLWFTVMGNSGLSFQQTSDDPEASGGVDIYGAMEAVDFDESGAMFAFLDGLPFPLFTTIATVLVIAIFFVTSSDSGSFVIDMIASGGNPNPPVGMRVFWSISEGAVAAVLLIAGGLDALQAGAITTGLPFTVVLLFVMVGILKGLRSERDGVTLRDVVAMPLIEGEGEAEVSRKTPPAATGTSNNPSDKS